MIAAARLRKAQIAAIGARFYAAHVKEIAVRIAQHSGTKSHSFLANNSSDGTEFVVITSDRGLCGGFNENLLRRLHDRWQEAVGRGVATSATVIGRKGRDFCKSKGLTPREVLVGFYDGLSMASVLPIAEGLSERFLSGEIGHVTLVYNRFKSAVSQDITMEPLLPYALGESDQLRIDYLYEPSREEVVGRLLTRALGARIYQALLESVASELAARMTAMDSATKNAADMIQALTMQFNRARQAAITKDLMDIVNGSESLKK